ncbi:hypothetical protein B0J12DRAFT_705381 [Macrophomina phaseolina]|uniref:Zinc finger RING/FYVE/PHD-type protein n=1 Tax=Macrophomina phaseolina TaxID=35725 RepID=A0ABQ8FS97_9PEZI|nr:hypothetical protein B0J12DRAFT_705381 [Macrophomina phaseolina]
MASEPTVAKLPFKKPASFKATLEMLESKSELEIIEAFKELDANERGAVLHYLSENKRMHVLFEIRKMSEQRFQRRMEELGQWETILRERHGKGEHDELLPYSVGSYRFTSAPCAAECGKDSLAGQSFTRGDCGKHLYHLECNKSTHHACWICISQILKSSLKRPAPDESDSDDDDNVPSPKRSRKPSKEVSATDRRTESSNEDAGERGDD